MRKCVKWHFLIFLNVGLGSLPSFSDDLTLIDPSDRKLHDALFQKGVAKIANRPHRLAIVEPGACGHYQCLFRSEGTNEINKILKEYAEVDSETREVVVDMREKLFGLIDDSKVRVDWEFSAFTKHYTNPWTHEQPPDQLPPSVLIHLGPGSKIDWAQVIIPEGVKVIDKRDEKPPTRRD